MGPMTGRAAGYCTGYPGPGFANPMPGRGGGGFGRGRGFRNRFYATGMSGWQRAAAGSPAWGAPYPAYPANQGSYGTGMSKEQELDVLKNQARQFQSGLEEINARIEELDKETTEKNRSN
jgi:hypothetical protein